MIAGADKITVAPVGRIAPAAATEAVGDLRQQEFQRALAGLVGKSMPAEVLSKLSDGSFLVKVAGTAARMMLPSNPQPGAELPLTLVSLNPRPTFQLTSAPQSAAIPAFVDLQLPGTAGPALYGPAGSAGSAPAAALQRAASLPGAAPLAPPLPDGDAASSRSTLSPAAQVISNVLQVAARAEHPQTSIVAPLPLLPAASADPAKLAAVLQGAIGDSGLFYESHVAEWSAGKRPLGDLQREPQMQRAARPESAAAAAPASTAIAASLATVAPAAADPATAQFINLQLTSQEQGRVAWQGQLWPGQDLAWEISRDPPERGARQDGGEAPEPPWRSALRLRFPLLGEIGATVVLAGDQVHIQLQAGSDEIGRTLRARAGALQGALEASGSTLASLTVGTAGAAGHD